jgi:hypothetical protein
MVFYQYIEFCIGKKMTFFLDTAAPCLLVLLQMTVVVPRLGAGAAFKP